MRPELLQLVCDPLGRMAYYGEIRSRLTISILYPDYMPEFSLPEAQLYRMLVGAFGRERIVPHMSVLAVCGGAIPQNILSEERPLPSDLRSWAKGSRCLFTLVDGQDIPKLVLDFEALDGGTVDPEKIEYHRVLRPVLDAAGVRFLTITNDEFAELLRPSGTLDLLGFFQDRFEELGFYFGPDSDSTC
ncbi:MAG: hypothetical protein EBZ48_02465 [Proteobacteria bacterium]|nr:hypothetical protein [Pseudomonadota bacterium]